MQHLDQNLIIKQKFHNKENEFCLLDTDNKMASIKICHFSCYRSSVA